MLLHQCQYTTLLLFILVPLPHIHTSSLCPSLCNQLACLTGSLSCSDRNALVSIPSRIPPNTRKILISNQNFLYPHLNRQNFSHIVPPVFSIVKLTLHKSSILSLAPYSFSGLTNLSFLDLSFNTISEIVPDTFHGLNLIFLRLDGNPALRIYSDSFRGLQVRKLSLVNCQMKHLPESALLIIQSSLYKLFINDNQLTRLDSKLQTLFIRRLDQLQLENNPWVCDCSNLWLIRLKLGVCDNQLHPSYFCRVPSVTAIDIVAVNPLQLLCISDDPHASIQWLYNHTTSSSTPGKSQLFLPQASSPPNQYISCLVSNSFGQSSLDLIITSPYLQSPPSTVYSSTESPLASSASSHKRFTLLEMISAMLATFMLSIALFMLVYQACKRRYFSSTSMKWRTPTTHPNYLHQPTNQLPASCSDLSQTYDVPHNSPPPPPSLHLHGNKYPHNYPTVRGLGDAEGPFITSGNHPNAAILANYHNTQYTQHTYSPRLI